MKVICVLDIRPITWISNDTLLNDLQKSFASSVLRVCEGRTLDRPVKSCCYIVVGDEDATSMRQYCSGNILLS